MIILIISHGIIQFTVFKFFQIKHKAEAVEIISEGVQVSEQIIFKFEKNNFDNRHIKIEWKDDNEFRYENEMFDLIKKEIRNDSVYLYCTYDEDDSKLYSILDKFLGLIFEENPDDPDELKIINVYFNQYYSGSLFTNDNYYPQLDNSYYDNYSPNLLDGEKLVNTPPPQA